MRPIVLCFVLLCLTWLSATFAKAATIHVPSDQPTIQAGINAASNGDVVLVAAGTYVENVNFMGKAITLRSQSGPNSTVIDGNAANPAVAFVTGETASSVITGFTLQNGVGTFDFDYMGGGISILAASPTVTGNIIKNNTAGDGGGVGIYFGSPIMSRNTISNNNAQFGGGIAIVGASTAQLLHNTISNNVAGAGAGLELFAAGDVIIENNAILNNTGAGQGGGFYIVNEADEVIVQNLIADNGATSGSQIYSLIPTSAQGFQLINNTIVSASQSGADAAVIADGFNTNVLIANNIIFAPGDHAALLCNPIYVDGPPIVEYNDAYNTQLAYGDSCAGFSGLNGNISASPLFVSVSKKNYQLRASSPAINVGTNSAPNLPAQDYLGRPRIVGGTIDMGAYESQIGDSPTP